MIKTLYVISRTGNLRVLDYHVKHDSDPPNVQTFHGKHPPIPHLVMDIGPDERSFDHKPTPEEIAEAFK